MEPSNNESQDSKVQDIKMTSTPRNQDREQERNNQEQERNNQEQERNNHQERDNHRRGGRGNYNRTGQPSHHRQNASANSVPYNGGTHWFNQSTYVGGWNYPAPHFTPPMRPYNRTALPLPQQHDSSAQNQGWHADPYFYGTPSPMIPPVNQGYLPPMAYYIPPNFGQQNMYNPEWPSLPLPPPPPPPTYQGKHFHNKELYWRIVNQVNYYFGDENLKGDTFLKNHMDADGWVPITLIATFNRMQQLTDDIAFILFALQGSSVVEVSGDKIRRRK